MSSRRILGGQGGGAEGETGSLPGVAFALEDLSVASSFALDHHRQVGHQSLGPASSIAAFWRCSCWVGLAEEQRVALGGEGRFWCAWLALGCSRAGSPCWLAC